MKYVVQHFTADFGGKLLTFYDDPESNYLIEDFFGKLFQ